MRFMNDAIQKARKVKEENELRVQQEAARKAEEVSGQQQINAHSPPAARKGRLRQRMRDNLREQREQQELSRRRTAVEVCEERGPVGMVTMCEDTG
jgi:hypothetical protein